MISQNEAILCHLRAGHAISALDALQNFGCLRLAARIRNLREQGFEIETIERRNGRKKWAEYRLCGS